MTNTNDRPTEPFFFFAQVKLRDGNKCRLCGRDVHWGVRQANRAGRILHIDPLSTGPANFICVCRECNMDALPLAPELRAHLIKLNRAMEQETPRSDGTRGVARAANHVELDLTGLPVGSEGLGILGFSQRRNLVPDGHGGSVKEEESIVADGGHDSGHVVLGSFRRGGLPRVEALDQDATADDVCGANGGIAADTDGQAQGLSFPQIVVNNFFNGGNQNVSVCFENALPVEQQLGHETSPLVGAPDGAVGGTPDPTGGGAGLAPGDMPRASPGIVLSGGPKIRGADLAEQIAHAHAQIAKGDLR